MPAKLTTVFLILFLLVLAVLSGYNYVTKPFLTAELFAQPENPQPSPTAVPTPSPISAAALLAEMEPRERIAQLLVVPSSIIESESASNSGIFSQNHLIPAEQQTITIADIQPGGFLLVGKELSVVEVSGLISKPEVSGPISEAAYLKPLIIVDHEGGALQRLSGEGFTKLPSWKELCALPKVQRLTVLERSALELAALEVDVVLAPVLDQAVEPLEFDDRFCSSDPTVITLAATDFTKAFLQAGVMPVFKHFPGLGQLKKDLHTSFESIEVSEAEAGIFRSMMVNYPDVPIMVSHAGILNQFATVPCSLSSSCVKEILTSFPDRLVITDSLDMAAVRTKPGGGQRPLEDVALDAIAAGNSLLLLGESVTQTELAEVMNVLQTEYDTNATFATRIDEAARKVLTLKLSL